VNCFTLARAHRYVSSPQGYAISVEGYRSDRTLKNPNRWFCSEEEAEAAEFRRATLLVNTGLRAIAMSRSAVRTENGRCSCISSLLRCSAFQWVQGPPGNRSLQKSLTVRWAVCAPRSGLARA
jgi:hypothetical protein